MQTASLRSSPRVSLRASSIFCVAISFSKLFAKGLILPGVGGRRARGLGHLPLEDVV